MSIWVFDAIRFVARVHGPGVLLVEAKTGVPIFSVFDGAPLSPKGARVLAKMLVAAAQEAEKSRA